MLLKLAENFNPTSPVYSGTAFNNIFNDLVTEITDGFNKASSVFSPSQTFSSQTNSVPYPPAGQPLGNNPLDPTNLNNAQANNGTHSNYVHTHTVNYTQQGRTMPDSAMGDGTSGSDVFQTLSNLITTQVNQPPFQTQQMQAISNLQEVFKDP
jgi:hypothetical protein